MSDRRRRTQTIDVVLAACGPVWLLGMGADEPSGGLAALVAAWAFLAAGAPWAIVRIVRLHRQWIAAGRPIGQAPRTPVLAVCLAVALVLAGLTIGGPVGGAVVNLAGLALLAAGVVGALVAFTPLGGALIGRTRLRTFRGGTERRERWVASTTAVDRYRGLR